MRGVAVFGLIISLIALILSTINIVQRKERAACEDVRSQLEEVQSKLDRCQEVDGGLLDLDKGACLLSNSPEKCLKAGGEVLQNMETGASICDFGRANEASETKSSPLAEERKEP